MENSSIGSAMGELMSEDISVVAQIMSVVDIYDALTTVGPYHAGMSVQEAIDILRESAAANPLDGKIVEDLADLVLGDRWKSV